jgi:hypothetical protein
VKRKERKLIKNHVDVVDGSCEAVVGVRRDDNGCQKVRNRIKL